MPTIEEAIRSIPSTRNANPKPPNLAILGPWNLDTEKSWGSEA